MKILLVPWALLLFGVSLNSGHYIRKAEDGEPSIYQGHDDSSITLDPKEDKRTLREILYYHIIERPRNEPVATEPVDDSYDDKVYRDEDDGSYVEHREEEQGAEHNEDHEEEPVFTTTRKPLTDQDVKEAYKTRSYLYDQMRQRYAVKRMAVPEPSFNRRKRQAEMESVPDATSYASDASKAAYMQPKTYGMNLNGDEGYVWNNLNNPPTYYELGSSNGNPNVGSSGPQSQENMPPPGEDAYIPPAEPNDSESSEDIYIVTNRPSAQPIETVPETANPEPSNESPELINDNSGLFDENPGPMNENPEPINDNPEPINENSGRINDNPELVNDNPAPIYENPEPINENPEPINDNPEPINENSGRINDNPELVNDNPAPINENPEPINDNPGLFDKNPGQMNENPEPINDNPEPNNENPGWINDNPELVNDNPAPVNENPEPINENPEPSDSGANYPVEPIIADDNSNLKPENEGFATNGPKYENPELPEQPETAEPSVPQEPEANEYPISGNPVGESTDNPGYGQQPEETKEESSEGDQIKEIPVAPTLPPLNYDGLPDYIRDAISSSEKPASYEQTDNPQPNPEDKQVMQDQMESIFATMQPVEDIPKTYGMNLTSEDGHVWNDMVSPPVSYNIGSPSQSEEEHKEQPPVPVSEQPEIHEPAEPEKEEPIANPEEPTQEPETHESEEDKPVEEPVEPEKKLEEAIANPSEENHEPTLENDNKPIEEPAEPTGQVEPEPAAEFENPEVQEPENPEPIPEPENPELVPEPGNEEPEHPELISELGNEEPENPELVSEPGNKEPENPELVPEPENEKPENLEPVFEPGNEQPENPELVPEPGNEDTEQTSEEPAEELNEEKDKPDIMSELLKSEQFWKLIGEWTATYMELLEKHIRKIAIQEICNREKSGEQMCLLEDKPKDDDGAITNDGKIIVDGKEIDITNTDNLDKDLRSLFKRGHQYNKGDNDKKIENKIEASKIYGNSVGSERVTNVFIFAADKAEEIIENLEPGTESEVDFVIDERIKENKNKKSTEVVDQSESNLGDTEPNTSEVNKEEGNNEETYEGGANKEEPNEENINESNIGENKEEVNNEEVIKEESEGDKEEFNKDESNEGEANIEESNKDANEPYIEEYKEEPASDIEDSKREDYSKVEPSESESSYKTART